ncbi:MAG TPA: hypothetical protein VFT16_00990 [Candidatus Saccharimonadales bacterium]|nr:hypothetical protein [Candidatus Saccharimonadales bacterium]
MSEQLNQPLFDPESLAYGDAVVSEAANNLRVDIDELAASAEPSVLVQIKTDPRGATSPVTRHDQETEERIGAAYAGTSVRIKGEEGVNRWPADKAPTLELHVDPIDGTELFIEYVEQLIGWQQLPEDNRPPRPTCGSMISAGAIRPGSNTPEWAAIAAPFASTDGTIRWNVGPGVPATRIEPDGSRRPLPLAGELSTPETGGVILVASNSAERIFGGPLQDAGYRVIKLKSAVAAALCAMDPGLFERLRPGELDGDPIVGVAMRTAKNWDVAGVVAVANDREHFVSTTDGNPRTFEDGANSAIIAIRASIGRAVVGTLAPYL